MTVKAKARRAYRYKIVEVLPVNSRNAQVMREWVNVSYTATATGATDKLLLETGDVWLLETGDAILLEDYITTKKV